MISLKWFHKKDVNETHRSKFGVKKKGSRRKIYISDWKIYIYTYYSF